VQGRAAGPVRPSFSVEDVTDATEMAAYTSLLLATSLGGSLREKRLIYTQRLNSLWHSFLTVPPPPFRE
jgi:hypothetical protein